MTDLADKALTRARNSCARRERCPEDIRKMLRRNFAELGDEDVRKIVGKLEEEGFLSEERYAGAYARDKASLDGWGPAKIRAGLCARGISREAIDNALASIPEARAGEKLGRLLESRERSLRRSCPEPEERRTKLIRFAMSRGYSFGQIAEALEKMTIFV